MEDSYFSQNFAQYDIPLLTNGVKLPSFKIPAEELQKRNLSDDKYDSNKISDYEFLLTLCLEGLESKVGSDNPKYTEYQKRLKIELDLFKELDFCGYALITWDIIRFCRKNNIGTGYARGSAAGSLVLYLIDVVNHVDPLKHGLYFERFLSKARAKFVEINGVKYYDGSLLFDVDLDIDFKRRSEVINYLEETYKHKTAKLLTVSTLSSKILIKEVIKIFLGKNEDFANEISDTIPKSFGKVYDIDKAIKESLEFASFAKTYPEAIKIAKKLHGLYLHYGVHASAVVIAADRIDNILPMQLTKDKELVTGYSMDDTLNLACKVDILGLRAATLIQSVCTMVGIKPDQIDLDNEIIYKNLQNLETPHGLFQIEADCNYGVLKKIKPRNLDDLSAIVAIARPGALQFVEPYAEFVETGKPQSIHPFFDDVFSESGGLCLFQEQIMKAANKIGFSLDESEQLRRCITKDTLFISKSRGYVSIKTLLETGYENDLFLVLDECGQQKWKPIKKIWSTGFHQVKRVLANNGMNVWATEWHQFLTAEGWKARKYLSKDDYLVCAGSVQWDGCDSIPPQMAIVISGLVTEGYFVDGHSATFVNHDKKVMDLFVQNFEFLFGENSLNLNNPNIACIRNKEKQEIRKYLHQGKSASKFLPECMMGMTKETTKSFLSFIFACEGTITEKEVSLTSKSRKFVEQIQLLLLRFHISSNIMVKKNLEYGDFYVLDIGQHSDVIKFNENLSVNLQEYKKDKLKVYCANIKLKTYGNDVIPASLFKKFILQYGWVLNYESGRWYHGNISRLNAQYLYNKLVYNGLKDSYWEKVFYGNQVYQKVWDLNDTIREIETFDFTVSDETPFIVANGMVIHNCIGKKKIDEIPAWQNKIKQKIEQNKIPTEAGDLLWKIAEDSANYQFNKSHAVAYASMSAATTYLKFKYPKEFFLTLLELSQDEPNPIEEISKIQKELEWFGIKLLPPHILRSDIKFKIEGDNIRMGLSSIKSISEKSLLKLKQFQKNYKNKFDIFDSAKSSGLNLSAVSALILVGCLDEMIPTGESRSKLQMEYCLWNILTKKERIWANKLSGDYNYNLIEIVKVLNERLKTEKGQPIIKDSRRLTIRRDLAPYAEIYKYNNNHAKLAHWYFETMLLGFSYSTSLYEIYKVEKNNLLMVRDVLNELQGCIVDFVAQVMEVKHGKSKEKQTPWFKIIANDHTGKVKIMMFDGKNSKNIQDCETQNGRLPKEGDVVIVTGKKMDGDCVFAQIVGIQKLDVFLKISQLPKEKQEEV